MSVDAQQVMELMSYFHLIWSAPLQIIISLVFLYLTVGPSTFVGFAVMIFMVPINALLSAGIQKLHAKQMGLKDSRIKLINKVLNGIKVCVCVCVCVCMCVCVCEWVSEWVTLSIYVVHLMLDTICMHKSTMTVFKPMTSFRSSSSMPGRLHSSISSLVPGNRNWTSSRRLHLSMSVPSSRGRVRPSWSVIL